MKVGSSPLKVGSYQVVYVGVPDDTYLYFFRYHVHDRKWTSDLHVTTLGNSADIVAASNATASTASTGWRRQER